jgi:hypothetical protein
MRVPAEPTAIHFRRRTLVFVLVFSAGMGGGCWVFAAIVFRDLGLTSWIGAILGLFIVLGGALMLWFAFFWFRALFGRPAVIIDAEGFTDRSSAFPLGRVAWGEVVAIHWQRPPTVYAARPYLAIDLRRDVGPLKMLRSRGIDAAKLAISGQELAHLFRQYSGGRFETTLG